MNKTKIEWADMVWNPLKTKCRRGCWYCFAPGIYKRFGLYHDGVVLDLNEMDAPRHRKKATRIFVGSMTDLLGDWVPDSVIKAVLEQVGECPQHTFMFLTKNPGRYEQFDWPGNCWLGASAPDQAHWDRAYETMQLTRVNEMENIKFISAEPLLEEISPGLFMPDWLIVGALTGPKARQYRPRQEWIDRLNHWCIDDRRPLLLKDNLGVIAPWREWPDTYRAVRGED